MPMNPFPKCWYASAWKVVTAVPGAALGTVVKRAGEGDVRKVRVAAATASVPL